MIYLAMPYSDVNPTVRQKREQIFYAVQAKLIENGELVVSPLDKIHMCTVEELSVSFDYWKNYCIHLLNRCDALYVITIEGWQNSSGVKAELDFARKNNKPIKFIDPEKFLGNIA